MTASHGDDGAVAVDVTPRQTSNVKARAYFAPTRRDHIVCRFFTTGPAGAGAAVGTSTWTPNCASRTHGFCGSVVRTGTVGSAGRKPYVSAVCCTSFDRRNDTSVCAAFFCASLVQSPARIAHG